MVKNLPATQKTRIRTLGCEDPLEKGMAIHSSIVAWRIPWTEEPGRLQSMGSQRARYDRAHPHTPVKCGVGGDISLTENQKGGERNENDSCSSFSLYRK